MPTKGNQAWSQTYFCFPLVCGSRICRNACGSLVVFLLLPLLCICHRNSAKKDFRKSSEITFTQYAILFQFLYILIRCKCDQTFVNENAIITHVYNINLAPSRYAYLTSMSFANLSNCRHSVHIWNSFSTNVLIYFAAFNSFIVFHYGFLCVFPACVANVSLRNFFFVSYAPRCLKYGLWTEPHWTQRSKYKIAQKCLT